MRKQKEIDTKVESGMKNFVITIGREFGSGGHNLGQSLAKELGIPCYDRHLIDARHYQVTIILYYFLSSGRKPGICS